MVDERFPPLLGNGRRRRRGSRSIEANSRRKERFIKTSNQQQPPSGSPGESGLVPLEIDTKILILSLIIRGFYVNKQI